MEHKEEINNQPEQNEETRIQKNEERLRRLWDISKSANIWIIGMPEGEGEGEEQEIENLFEKNNERKLSCFGKGDRHKSPGNTESQTGWNQRGLHQDTS